MPPQVVIPGRDVNRPNPTTDAFNQFGDFWFSALGFIPPTETRNARPIILRPNPLGAFVVTPPPTVNHQLGGVDPVQLPMATTDP